MLYVFNVLGFQEPGGGEVQVMKSREYLQRIGVCVDFFDPFKQMQDYDLLHAFGLTYHTFEVTSYWKRVLQRPLIISPLWWSFDEYYLKTGKLHMFIRNKVFRFLRRIAFTKTQKFLDMCVDVKGLTIAQADTIIATSHSERELLAKEFAVEIKRIQVVPNGVDPLFRYAKAESFEEKYGLSDYVLCVAGIYPKKNQLALIKALRGTDFPLVFIGARIDPHYFKLCYEEGRKRGNTYFIDPIPHSSELLASAYAAAKVLVLPSWFDAPGLVTLEAALAGTKVVVTNRGPMREYFGDLVTYIDPGSISDIRNKVLKAYFDSSSDQRLREHVYKNFTWDKVAERLRDCYSKVLLG